MRKTFLSGHAGRLAPLVVILGTNEIASAVAVHLTTAGYCVILSHDSFPPVIRRGMAFHDALFGDRAVVEQIEGLRAERAMEVVAVLKKPDHVAVTPLHLTDLIAAFSPQILIDARMQKDRITPDYRGIVHLTIGLGPNFAVGVNCDIAVETKPSKCGMIVENGWTDQPDGISRLLGGVGGQRFVYSDQQGRWHTAIDIGMRTFKGYVVGHLDGRAVRAPIDGLIRGIVRDSTSVPLGVKLLEIDARGRQANWTGIDERGRSIAQATVKAIRLHASRDVMADAATSSYLI